MRPRWARGQGPRPNSETFSSLPGEERSASEFGGSRRPMSGAGKRPYDWASPDFLTDRKETHAESHALSRKKLEQLRRRALQEGRVPLYEVIFWDDGDVTYEWALVPRAFLLEQVAYLAHLHAQLEGS